MHVVPFHRAVAGALCLAAAVAMAGAAVATADTSEAAEPVAPVVQPAPFIGPRAPMGLAFGG